MEIDTVGKPVLTPSPSAPRQPEQEVSPQVTKSQGPATVDKAPHTAKAKADATAAALERAKVDHEQFKAFLDKLNIAVNALDIQAHFSVHEATKEVMVQVVNVETGKVIREVPPKKILDMVAQMLDMVGLLVDERG